MNTYTIVIQLSDNSETLLVFDNEKEYGEEYERLVDIMAKIDRTKVSFHRIKESSSMKIQSRKRVGNESPTDVRKVKDISINVNQILALLTE